MTVSYSESKMMKNDILHAYVLDILGVGLIFILGGATISRRCHHSKFEKVSLGDDENLLAIARLFICDIDRE